MTDISVEDVVAKYRALRDKKSAIEAETKEKVAAIKESMALIENYLMDLSNKTGIESFKTQAGTAYVSETQAVKVTDWDEVLEFIKHNDQYELLTRKVSATVARDIVDELGKPIPGVELVGIKNVRFRAPAKKARK